MPRVVPWQRAENGTSIKREQTPRKRVKIEPELDRDITPKAAPLSPTKRDFFRSSQSPPTSPTRQCPPEEFLVPGIKQDDGWVMVEDEFYAMAQTYTQHLHYAEYLRRRKQVKIDNSATLEGIERPTDNRTPLPKHVEKQREIEALRERQKNGLAHLVDEKAHQVDDEDDQRWAGTHLHGLMTSPRKARPLTGAHTLKLSTQAAVGYKQAPAPRTTRPQVNSAGSPAPPRPQPDIELIDLDEDTASGSDDDMDQETRPVMQPPPTRAQSISQYRETPRTNRESRLRDTSTPKRGFQAGSGRASQGPAFKTKIQSLFDGLDELPEPSRAKSSISINQKPSITQQPETGNANNLDPKRNQDNNQVPTFLT